MDKLILIIVAFFIVVAFFEGNIMLIIAACGGDSVDWSEYWIIVVIAVVMDLILLWLVMAKIIPPVSSSFRLMRSGIKNRRIAKKESAKLKKLLKKQEPDLNRLRELRDKKITESATKRTLHFCRLIETIDGTEQLRDCMSEVSMKQSVLDEIKDIEESILNVAERCKNAGDIKKCNYYLDILKSTKITPEITTLENECKWQLSQRDREKNAIRSWQKGACWFLLIIITASAALYIRDTPYRELRTMIRNQSLTAEMCAWKYRNSEESYYEYINTNKGRNLIASELTKFHEEDDVLKAMWLLCIQPNRVDGYDLWASPSFIEWILGYARMNGVRSVEERAYGEQYVTYTVDGYQIIMTLYNDGKGIGNIYQFSISDGENQIAIDKRSRYDDTVPAIE